MTEQEKQAIVDVLGRTDEHRFYVYALVDPRNNQPFYIGKGQKDRVLQHEDYYLKYLKNKENNEINNEINYEDTDSYKEEKDEIENDSDLSDNEKEEKQKELSAKYERIKDIIDHDKRVQNVIIKWGLTEEEAFAAESALINLYKYQEVELTNIQNGHASKKEKDSGLGTTKALIDKDFYNANAKPSIHFEELNYSKIHQKILFVNIATDYDAGMPDELIKEISRGRWGVNIEHFNNNEYYLCAVNDSVVRGIYKISAVHSGTDIDDFPLAKGTRINEKRKAEMEFLISNKEALDNLDCEVGNASTDLEEKYTRLNNKGTLYNWYKRKYFSLEDVSDDEKIENFKYMNCNTFKYKDLIGCRLVIIKDGKEHSPFIRSSFRYNK